MSQQLGQLESHSSSSSSASSSPEQQQLQHQQESNVSNLVSQQQLQKPILPPADNFHHRTRSLIGHNNFQFKRMFSIDQYPTQQPSHYLSSGSSSPGLFNEIMNNELFTRSSSSAAGSAENNFLDSNSQFFDYSHSQQQQQSSDEVYWVRPSTNTNTSTPLDSNQSSPSLMGSYYSTSNNYQFHHPTYHNSFTNISCW